MATIIINLVGKSSTNENIANFLKKHHVIRIVSTTTRAMRPAEVEGEDYYYISVEEHMRLRNEGQIFEAVSLDTREYSHCKSELNKLKFGGLRILETNPEGMRQIIKHLSGHGVKILSFRFDVDEETQRISIDSIYDLYDTIVISNSTKKEDYFKVNAITGTDWNTNGTKSFKINNQQTYLNLA
uniref:Guanylate kinase-like domain-containing protein n=1 Tax=Eptatretus burgeri TaxID=7764 RepID=A0A8C4NFP4_EPTBU